MSEPSTDTHFFVFSSYSLCFISGDSISYYFPIVYVELILQGMIILFFLEGVWVWVCDTCFAVVAVEKRPDPNSRLFIIETLFVEVTNF